MKPTRLAINCVIALWILHGLTLTAATVAQVSPGLVADLAKDKGIIWLAVVTAIMSISANIWLIKQYVRQGIEAVTALNKLSAELSNRPCVIAKHKDLL